MASQIPPKVPPQLQLQIQPQIAPAPPLVGEPVAPPHPVPTPELTPELSPGGLRAALLRSARAFSVATMVSVLSGLLRSYYVLRLLGPAAAGLWLGLQLVVSYGANAHLGAIYGMHRHLPLLRGRADLEGAEVVRRTTFTFTLLAGLVAFAVVAAASLGLFSPLERLVPERVGDLLGHLREPQVRSVVLGVGALLPINLLRAFYVTLFKAENRFHEASVASILGSVVGVASILLIPAFGLAGAVWGLFALVGVEAAYLGVRAGRSGLGLRWTVLRDQLAVGVLTVGTTVVATALGSTDRTVLMARFAAEARGYYSPALLAGTFLAGLAAVPNSVLFPRLAERFGRTGRPGDLASLVEGPLALVAAGFALVGGAGVIATPALLRLALPQYVPGALATQIAIPGIAAYCTVGVVVSVLSALNRQWLYLAILGFSAAASYGVTHAAVQQWPGIEAVALGADLGFLLYVVLAVVGSWLAMERPLGEALLVLGRTLAPLLWSALCTGAIVFGLGRLLSADSLMAAVIGEVLLLLCVGPWLLVVVRRVRGVG